MVFGLMFFVFVSRLVLHLALCFGLIFQSFAFIAVKVQLLLGFMAQGNGGIMNGLSIFNGFQKLRL